MSRRKLKNTRSKIATAAWKLFYEQGYENTTIEEIVEESETSKGSFYHYFPSKDALLGSLSDLFDDKYHELLETLDPAMNSYDKLIFLNQELFGMIENSVSLDLLARLFSTQLLMKGERTLMDHNRYYFRVLHQIITEGQERGEITKELSVSEISRIYALCERGLMYDWCICSGNYSLRNFSATMMPMFLGKLRTGQPSASGT